MPGAIAGLFICELRRCDGRATDAVRMKYQDQND